MTVVFLAMPSIGNSALFFFLGLLLFSFQGCVEKKEEKTPSKPAKEEESVEPSSTDTHISGASRESWTLLPGNTEVKRPSRVSVGSSDPANVLPGSVRMPPSVSRLSEPAPATQGSSFKVSRSSRKTTPEVSATLPSPASPSSRTLRSTSDVAGPVVLDGALAGEVTPRLSKYSREHGVESSRSSSRGQGLRDATGSASSSPDVQSVYSVCLKLEDEGRLSGPFAEIKPHQQTPIQVFNQFWIIAGSLRADGSLARVLDEVLGPRAPLPRTSQPAPAPVQPLSRSSALDVSLHPTFSESQLSSPVTELSGGSVASLDIIPAASQSGRSSLSAAPKSPASSDSRSSIFQREPSSSLAAAAAAASAMPELVSGPQKRPLESSTLDLASIISSRPELTVFSKGPVASFDSISAVSQRRPPSHTASAAEMPSSVDMATSGFGLGNLGASDNSNRKARASQVSSANTRQSEANTSPIEAMLPQDFFTYVPPREILAEAPEAAQSDSEGDEELLESVLNLEAGEEPVRLIEPPVQYREPYAPLFTLIQQEAGEDGTALWMAIILSYLDGDSNEIMGTTVIGDPELQMASTALPALASRPFVLLTSSELKEMQPDDLYLFIMDRFEAESTESLSELNLLRSLLHLIARELNEEQAAVVLPTHMLENLQSKDESLMHLTYFYSNLMAFFAESYPLPERIMDADMLRLRDIDPSGGEELEKIFKQTHLTPPIAAIAKPVDEPEEQAGQSTPLGTETFSVQPDVYGAPDLKRVYEVLEEEEGVEDGPKILPVSVPTVHHKPPAIDVSDAVVPDQEGEGLIFGESAGQLVIRGIAVRKDEETSHVPAFQNDYYHALLPAFFFKYFPNELLSSYEQLSKLSWETLVADVVVEKELDEEEEEEEEVELVVGSEKSEKVETTPATYMDVFRRVASAVTGTKMDLFGLVEQAAPMSDFYNNVKEKSESLAKDLLGESELPEEAANPYVGFATYVTLQAELARFVLSLEDSDAGAFEQLVLPFVPKQQHFVSQSTSALSLPQPTARTQTFSSAKIPDNSKWVSAADRLPIAPVFLVSEVKGQHSYVLKGFGTTEHLLVPLKEAVGVYTKLISHFPELKKSLALTEKSFTPGSFAGLADFESDQENLLQEMCTHVSSAWGDQFKKFLKNLALLPVENVVSKSLVTIAHFGDLSAVESFGMFIAHLIAAGPASEQVLHPLTLTKEDKQSSTNFGFTFLRATKPAGVFGQRSSSVMDGLESFAYVGDIVVGVTEPHTLTIAEKMSMGDKVVPGLTSPTWDFLRRGMIFEYPQLLQPVAFSSAEAEHEFRNWVPAVAAIDQINRACIASREGHSPTVVHFLTSLCAERDPYQRLALFFYLLYKQGSSAMSVLAPLAQARNPPVSCSQCEELLMEGLQVKPDIEVSAEEKVKFVTDEQLKNHQFPLDSSDLIGFLLPPAGSKGVKPIFKIFKNGDVEFHSLGYLSNYDQDPHEVLGSAIPLFWHPAWSFLSAQVELTTPLIQQRIWKENLLGADAVTYASLESSINNQLAEVNKFIGRMSKLAWGQGARFLAEIDDHGHLFRPKQSSIMSKKMTNVYRYAAFVVPCFLEILRAARLSTATEGQAGTLPDFSELKTVIKTPSSEQVDFQVARHKIAYAKLLEDSERLAAIRYQGAPQGIYEMRVTDEKFSPFSVKERGIYLSSGVSAGIELFYSNFNNQVTFVFKALLRDGKYVANFPENSGPTSKSFDWEKIDKELLNGGRGFLPLGMFRKISTSMQWEQVVQFLDEKRHIKPDMREELYEMVLNRLGEEIKRGSSPHNQAMLSLVESTYEAFYTGVNWFYTLLRDGGGDVSLEKPSSLAQRFLHFLGLIVRFQQDNKLSQAYELFSHFVVAPNGESGVVFRTGLKNQETETPTARVSYIVPVALDEDEHNMVGTGQYEDGEEKKERIYFKLEGKPKETAAMTLPRWEKGFALGSEQLSKVKKLLRTRLPEEAFGMNLVVDAQASSYSDLLTRLGSLPIIEKFSQQFQTANQNNVNERNVFSVVNSMKFQPVYNAVRSKLSEPLKNAKIFVDMMVELRKVEAEKQPEQTALIKNIIELMPELGEEMQQFCPQTLKEIEAEKAVKTGAVEMEIGTRSDESSRHAEVAPYSPGSADELVRDDGSQGK